MNPKQVQLVQESFAKVQPIAAQAAQMFYQRLFELDPKLKKLFKGDMVAQGVKLMSMIAAAVKGLSNVDKLVPVLQGLGSRHGGYGVKPAGYGTGGQALLWTPGKGPGGDFTPAVARAWTQGIWGRAEGLQGGAETPPGAPAPGPRPTPARPRLWPPSGPVTRRGATPAPAAPAPACRHCSGP